MSDAEPWRGLAADLRRGRTAAGRESLGAFTVEGWRLVERAVAAGATPRAVLVPDDLDPSAREGALAVRLREAGCDVFTAPHTVLEALVEGRSFGDILALVGLPAQCPLDELLADAKLVLAAHAIQDPGNLGALWRTALASGCDAIVSVGGSDPFHPKAVRASMGAVFRIPLHRLDEPEPLLVTGAAAGLVHVGAVSQAGERLPGVGSVGSGSIAWLGSEAFGLPASLTARLDRLVTIPMAPRVDSLSVNAAAAIVLYQLRFGAS